MGTISRSVSAVAGFAIATLSGKLLTLATTYVIAYFSTNESFGYFAIAQSSFIFSIVFFGFSLNSFYLRNFYETNLSSIVQALKPVYFVLSLSAAAASAFSLFIFQSHSHYFWLAAMPICGFLAGISVSQSTIFRCAQRLRAFLASELFRPLFLLCSLLACLFFLESINIVALYSISLLFSYSLAVALLSTETRRSFPERPIIAAPLTTKEALLYSGPLVAVQLMSALNNMGDRYIMAAFLPIDAVGLYAKAYLYGSTVGVLADSLTLLWGPYVVKNRDNQKNFILHRARIIFFLSVIISTTLLFGALLLSLQDSLEVYRQTIITGVIVFSAFIARIGYQIYSPILASLNLTAVIAKISLIGCVTGIAMNFLLIPPFGGFGAALATWVSFFIFSLSSYLIVERAYPRSARKK